MIYPNCNPGHIAQCQALAHIIHIMQDSHHPWAHEKPFKALARMVETATRKPPLSEDPVRQAEDLFPDDEDPHKDHSNEISHR